MYTRLFVLSLLFVFNTVSPGIQAQTTEAEAILASRGDQFSPAMVRVAENVYTAVGYSPANVSMIIGADGIILVDTAMSARHAEFILAEFRKITDLPVSGIIYTHGHGDHTGGAAVFLKDVSQPEIWARHNFGSEDRPLNAAGMTIQEQRGIRQAGFALPDNLRINNGIAPAMRPDRANAFANQAVSDNADTALPDTAPNRTFDAQRQIVEISGIQLTLAAAPGETDDQLYVWYPEQQVLFAGDNYYRSFPNLYAIRGTPYRDVYDWIQSLDAMIAEQPSSVVPGHTLPVIGKTASLNALQDYRDAIRFVHDKTVEGMNLGMSPEQLVDFVKLPPELAAKPDLGEYYGRVAWAVRAIFTGYLGWYDGNPSNLAPLSPAEEARKVAELAGGIASLLTQARQSLARGEAQWTAQLCDYVLALNSNDVVAKRLKANALTILARDSVNALGRNYYLTVAQQLRQEADN